jgi:hypothetical protein
MAKKPPKKPASRRKPKPELPPERPNPTCNAFLICEKVIKDEFFGTISLVGLFTEFRLAGVPTYLPRFWTFLQLSDGQVGSYPIEVEIQDLVRNEVIHRFDGSPAIFNSRLEVVDCIILAPPLLISSKSGVYAVVVFADKRQVASQKFTVVFPGDANENATEAE